MSACRVLFLAANPIGTERASLDEECRAISRSVPGDQDHVLELSTKWAVRPLDLLQYLNELQPQVVHFSGHGTPEEEIILVDDRGGPLPVSANALEKLFGNFKDSVRVVVLNACYSARQASAIVSQVDCAIGMNQAIGDVAARTFAAAFYYAIASGRSVLNAFEQGKTAIMMMGIDEDATPELLQRDGVDADAIVLAPRRDAPPDTPPDAAPIAPPIAPPIDMAATTNAAPPLTPTLLTPGEPPPPPPASTAPLSRAVLGAWLVTIMTPFATGQLQLEVLPSGDFHGYLNIPGASSTVDGRWQVNDVLGRIGLQGRQVAAPGPGMPAMYAPTLPYFADIQVTYFDPQQIVGFTSANEQVTWQRTGPPAGP